MKTYYPFVLLFFTAVLITSCTSGSKTDAAENLQTIPAEVIVDKIRGGLLGQILGNLNGFEYEFDFIEEPGNVTGYIPGLPEGARTDDDTDFEWFYVYEMQKSRTAFLPMDTVAKLWKERVNRGVYCSNRFARYLMDLGIHPPYTGYSAFNPWAHFNISGQFLSETFGLIAPGMPQTAARIGLNYTTVAINNEPAQTTQLFTTMISTAFFENDINKILEAGIAAIDKSSDIHKVITDIKTWHGLYPDNWRETRRMLKEKYTQEGGTFRDINGYELSTGASIASLLYGKGDFIETMQHAFNFGWDADNTAANVGTIIGVIYGYKKMLNHNDEEKPQWQIVDRYRNTTRPGMPMDETITSFADRVIELFEMVNENNGGEKTVVNNVVSYKIPVEKPGLIIPLQSQEEQNKYIIEKFRDQITEDLLSGERDRRARAAYMAVCLDIHSNLADQYPEQWKIAHHDLQGFWKVMHNIFDRNFRFQSLKDFQQKFEMAGFRAPAIQYKGVQLYNDSAYWKDPGEIYE